LDISLNSFSKSIPKEFIKGLNQNTTLMSIEANCIPDKILPTFLDVIGNSRSVTHLSLNGNLLAPITTLLSTAIYILSLDLSNSSFKGKDILALTEALKKNGALTQLNLSKCQLTDSDCTYISNYLVQGKNLLSLNLQENSITAKGFSTITEVLSEHNTNLTKLNLSFNQINDEILPHLLQLIHHNPYLRLIDIKKNNLSNSSLFKQQLEHFPSITTFSFE